MDDLLDRLQSIIAIELQVDPASVRPSSSLREDLGMDSIAALNILFAAQIEFGIGDVAESEIPGLVTVADAETLIRRYLETACP